MHVGLDSQQHVMHVANLLCWLDDDVTTCMACTYPPFFSASSTLALISTCVTSACSDCSCFKLAAVASNCRTDGRWRQGRATHSTLPDQLRFCQPSCGTCIRQHVLNGTACAVDGVLWCAAFIRLPAAATLLYSGLCVSSQFQQRASRHPSCPVGTHMHTSLPAA